MFKKKHKKIYLMHSWISFLLNIMFSIKNYFYMCFSIVKKIFVFLAFV
jgi:hypothetical protein